MKTDPALPDDLELEAGVDAALPVRERQELEELASLLSAGQEFELAPAARTRGRAELDLLLQQRQAVAKRRRMQRPWLWVGLPLAAAILFAWLGPLGRHALPTPASAPELATAQSLVLTAELTGDPVPRKDLERATRRYRKDLLASLGKTR